MSEQICCVRIPYRFHRIAKNPSSDLLFLWLISSSVSAQSSFYHSTQLKPIANKTIPNKYIKLIELSLPWNLFKMVQKRTNRHTGIITPVNADTFSAFEKFNHCTYCGMQIRYFRWVQQTLNPNWITTFSVLFIGIHFHFSLSKSVCFVCKVQRSEVEKANRLFNAADSMPIHLVFHRILPFYPMVKTKYVCAQANSLFLFVCWFVCLCLLHSQWFLF